MNGFDLSTITNCYVGGTQASAIYYGSTKIWPPAHDYSQDYLTLETLSSGSISFDPVFDVEPLTHIPGQIVKISLDGETWNEWQYSYNNECWIDSNGNLSQLPTTGTLQANTKTYWQVTANRAIESYIQVPGYDIKTYGYKHGKFSSTCYFSAYGNLYSIGINAVEDPVHGHKNNLRFANLFEDCIYLSSVENLRLPISYGGEFAFMFKGCTSLTNIPIFRNDNTLARAQNHRSMFEGCTSLQDASSLIIYDTSESSYYEMFKNCTSLTVSPELRTASLSERCYYGMFNGCTSLNNITCLATDISATNCTNSWLAGVASTGTFIKAVGMTGWSTGVDGIPSGWTTQDYT